MGGIPWANLGVVCGLGLVHTSKWCVLAFCMVARFCVCMFGECLVLSAAWCLVRLRLW